MINKGILVGICTNINLIATPIGCGVLGNFNVSMDQDLLSEMNQINIDMSKYPGITGIISGLQKASVPGIIIAGLIGCIIPESGTNHRILNATEYKGGGASGTNGWNCGEGLVQWTYWRYKLPLIQKYNADSRTTQKLPTDWGTYSQGSPQNIGGLLVANEDGKHIAGLTLDNQMIFLAIYYSDLIRSLSNETNLALVCAKIYQKKAGIGFCTNISDPIRRAYETAKRYYPSSGGNHFLKSVKFAQQVSGN